MLRFDRALDELERKSEFGNFLSNLGGTIFTNTYTHSPDTPRSLGSFWSGKEPKINKCDTRLKYPYFFLNKESINLLKLAKENNYYVNVCANRNKLNNGIIPLKFKKIDVLEDSSCLDVFLNKIDKTKKKSLTFIDLSDMHWVLDDFSHSKLAETYGVKKLYNAIDLIFKKINKSDFDLILFFSDHGHQYNFERGQKFLLDILDDSRSKIYAQIWNKSNNEINFNSELFSICDIGNLLQSAISEDDPNVLMPIPREYLLVEDHIDFSVNISMPIGVWRLITKQSSLTIDYKGNYKSSVKNSDLLIKLIEKKSSNFLELRSQYDTLKFYNLMKSERPNFSDGSKRYHPLILWLLKIPFYFFNYMLEKIEKN